MSSNQEIIREFIGAWSRLDAEELVEYFTRDGTYYNIPAQPVSGRENLIAFISGFLKDWSSTQWEILNLTGEGDLVIAERMDRTKVGDKSVDLQCCGVFEMQDGKIKEWRDYFDMNTYIKALQ